MNPNDSKSPTESTCRVLRSIRIAFGLALCLYLALWLLTKTVGVADVEGRSKQPGQFRTCFDIYSPIPLVIATSRMNGEDRNFKVDCTIERNYHFWLFGLIFPNQYSIVRKDIYRSYLRAREKQRPFLVDVCL